MNQFAIDKAGFTRYMLSPLSIRELLQGKAVGNALIAGGPAVCCFVVPALVFRGGSLAMWLALLFSVIATYTLVAPAAAALSAIFPTHRRSQQHRSCQQRPSGCGAARIAVVRRRSGAVCGSGPPRDADVRATGARARVRLRLVRGGVHHRASRVRSRASIGREPMRSAGSVLLIGDWVTRVILSLRSR